MRGDSNDTPFLSHPNMTGLFFSTPRLTPCSEWVVQQLITCRNQRNKVARSCLMVEEKAS